MRLLLFNYEFPPIGGGAGNAAFHIARELVRSGDKVFIITSHYKGLPKRETKDGINIIRVSAWRRYKNKSNPFQMSLYILSSVWFILVMGRSLEPDASLAFLGIPSAPPALLLKAVRKVPYIVSLRGGDVPGSQPEQLAFFHKITKPLIKIIWKKAAKVVANSRGLAQLANITLPKVDITVIPNGVDLETFHPVDKSDRGNKDTCRLIFAGRASAEKNIPEALDALRTIIDYPWEFIIIGDGPELPEWKERAAQIKMDHKIKFAGWKSRDDLARFYQESDIFIFPSTSEGMPNVVLEAIASGLPVVATRIRGNEDIIQHEINGFLYAPGDVESLSKYLKVLLQDRELRNRMSLEARKRAEQFSWKKVAREYRLLLEEAIHG